MRITRRDFLHSAAVFSAMGFAPRFLTQASAAAPNPIEGFLDDRILVVVQLGGGNDGLNTLVPHGDDAYYRARPRLGLRGRDVLRIDDHVALNARLARLKELYDEGLVSIVQGVGYPNPDRSHFRSMEIWHTASASDEYLGDGWVGRYFDNTCGGTARPQAGLALGNEWPQAFEGRSGIGISTDDPSRFGWQPGAGADDEAAFAALHAGAAPEGSTLDFLRHTTGNAIRSSAEVQRAAERGGVAGLAAAGGRQGRGDQLSLVAGLIRGGLATRIYYVSVGGFDTHANQQARHDTLLTGVGSALAQFQRQLEKDGNAGRVLTMVFSEFGRRVAENASGGTDHGTAAPMFLVGRGVVPGLHGAYPSLTDLDGGDLKHTVDFRSVYAAVLGGWLGADPGKVVPGVAGAVPVIA